MKIGIPYTTTALVLKLSSYLLEKLDLLWTSKPWIICLLDKWSLFYLFVIITIIIIAVIIYFFAPWQVSYLIWAIDSQWVCSFYTLHFFLNVHVLWVRDLSLLTWCGFVSYI